MLRFLSRLLRPARRPSPCRGPRCPPLLLECLEGRFVPAALNPIATATGSSGGSQANELFAVTASGGLFEQTEADGGYSQTGYTQIGSGVA